MRDAPNSPRLSMLLKKHNNIRFLSTTWSAFLLKSIGFGFVLAAGLSGHPLVAAVGFSDADEEDVGEPNDETTESETDTMLRAARQVQFGQIRFDKSTHDFGQVKRGEKLKYRFTFKNIGKGPLKLQGVHAACGCTAAELDVDREYAPQQTGAIDVTFDTTDFNGRIVKAVTVMTNERHVPDRTLSVRATIVSEFEVSPPMVDFGEVLSQDGPTIKLVVKPQSGQTFAIEKIRFNSETLTVNSAAKSGSPGTYHIDVTLKAGLMPGFLKETILVRNNSKSLPELRIPVRATIRGNLDIEPRYLEFGAISPSDRSSRSVTVVGNNDFEIKRVRMDLNLNGNKVSDADEMFKINAVSADKNKKLVAVELLNKKSRSGSVHGKIFIETTDPLQSEIPVDFYAFFR